MTYKQFILVAALFLSATSLAAQNSATLTDLTLTTNAGETVTLDPDPFAPATTSYTATVPYSVIYVTVAATSADDVHYLFTDSNTLSGEQVNLNRGSTKTIHVEARASGKSTTRYTVVVTSTPASTDAELDGLALTLSDGTTPVPFSPAFAATTTSYSASIPHTTTSLDSHTNTARRGHRQIPGGHRFRHEHGRNP